MARTARPSPYTDTALTQRGPFSQSVADPDPLPGNRTGATRVYDDAATNQDGPFTAADPLPLVNHWKRSRDPYAVGGAAGQSFLNNQS